jgi:shikimate 5-dehydrogenase
VNTLVFEAGQITGDNTDGAGLVRDLKHNLGCDPAGRRILLLGAGGAARGVILPLLLENPAELLIANRTEETAARLALEFARLPGCAVGVKPDGTGFAGLSGRRFDLVINATSAGFPVPRCRCRPGSSPRTASPTRWFMAAKPPSWPGRARPAAASRTAWACWSSRPPKPSSSGAVSGRTPPRYSQS